MHIGATFSTHRTASRALATGAAAAATDTAATAAVAAAVATPPRPAKAPRQLTARGCDVLEALEPWVGRQLLTTFSGPPSDRWQPSDLLPDPASPTFTQDILTLREAALQLPNDLLVVVAGAAVAGEVAPGYLSLLNAMEATGDKTGAQGHAWARFARSWAADKARHGQLLCSWLYLSGRSDMRAVQRTVQRLIGAGLDAGVGDDPYKMMIYSAFQERASRVFHGNAARLASYHGAQSLSRALLAVSEDSARHEEAFALIVARIFASDPEGAIVALCDVVTTGLVMPGALMDDGWHQEANHHQSDGWASSSSSGGGGGSSSGSGSGGASEDPTVGTGRRRRGRPKGTSKGAGSSNSSSSSCRVAAASSSNKGGGPAVTDRGHGGDAPVSETRGSSALFRDWAAVADALGVLTISDHAAILQHMMDLWDVPNLPLESEEAAAARQLLASLPQGLRRMGELQLERRLRDRREGRQRSASFSWIYKREVSLA